MESLGRGKWLGRNGYPRPGVDPHEWACIDLAEYADYDAFVKKLKKAGASFYEGRKAEKRGYYTKFFDESTFIADIVAVDTSTPERQGKPVSDSWLLPVERRGGYPTEFRQPRVPTQGIFWLRKFGTFRALPGHRQGDLVVDEQLVSYLSVRCLGNFACYNMILGHNDFLRDGVVHKMHLDFVKTVLEARNQVTGEKPGDISLQNLRYIGYAAYFNVYPGLKRWKKSNLFQPGLFSFDFNPTLNLFKPNPTS